MLILDIWRFPRLPIWSKILDDFLVRSGLLLSCEVSVERRSVDMRCAQGGAAVQHQLGEVEHDIARHSKRLLHRT